MNPAEFFEALARRLSAERPLDLTAGQGPVPGRSYDLIRFQMPPDPDEAWERWTKLRRPAEPVCVWLMEGAFEPLATGFSFLARLHDRQPEISYATAVDVARPWTLLWPAPPAGGRRPYFPGRADQAGFSPATAGLMVPVSEELAPALVGLSLSPADYLDEDHWRRLAAARAGAEARRAADLKLEARFKAVKPDQFRRLKELG